MPIVRIARTLAPSPDAPASITAHPIPIDTLVPAVGLAPARAGPLPRLRPCIARLSSPTRPGSTPPCRRTFALFMHKFILCCAPSPESPARTAVTYPYAVEKRTHATSTPSRLPAAISWPPPPVQCMPHDKLCAHLPSPVTPLRLVSRPVSASPSPTRPSRLVALISPSRTCISENRRCSHPLLLYIFAFYIALTYSSPSSRTLRITTHLQPALPSCCL